MFLDFRVRVRGTWVDMAIATVTTGTTTTMAAAVVVAAMDTTTTATAAAITEATAVTTLAAANIGTNSDLDIQSSHLDMEWAVEWVIGEAAVVVEEADIIIGMVDTTKITPTTTKTKIEAKEINETKTQSKVYVVSPGTSLLIPCF